MIHRIEVYNKYNGRCAYCGKELSLHEMQIDHIKAKCQGGSDDLENLNPSCRLCNHYKRSCTLDQFKNWLLAGIIDRLKQNYIFKIAEQYGMITIIGWDKKFYYEKEEEDE